MSKERVHFIAVGGSIMHSLAVCLHKMGYQVSGSDDEIFEPAKSTLDGFGLLPTPYGWDESKITKELDFVILGMHAKPDNPEYLKAKELGITVYSFPEFMYQASKNKQRIVIAGSHGKTTITSMIMHVLKEVGKNFDYMVGAKIEGFPDQVKITNNAPIVIIEGDEYLTSLEDRRPKFLNYFHHIAVVSGIAWDHINVYPDYNDYIHQFELLADMTPRSGKLIYYKHDETLVDICVKEREDVKTIPYEVHPHKIVNGKTILTNGNDEYPINVFGEHNITNLTAAKEVCVLLGIDDITFFKAIASFKGAARRLELVKENESKNSSVYKDFAHAPSKVKATTQSMKKQYDNRKLIACLELHTYSSLNKKFLPHYENALELADDAFVYYNPKTLEIKRLDPISDQEIKNAFVSDVEVFTDSKKLKDKLENLNIENSTLLMMSSGNYDNLDLNELADKLI